MEISLQSKVQEMLKPFNRQHFCFKLLCFESKKASLREKHLLRLKLSEEITKWKKTRKLQQERRQKNKQRDKLEKSQKQGNQEQSNQKQWNQEELRKLLKPEAGSFSSIPFPSLSFSYSLNCGAFLYLFEQNISIGFDIERKDRVKEATVCRVSSKKEQAEALTLHPVLHPALLWVAKEAALKCLSNGREKLLMRDCLISQWRKAKTLYLFTAKSIKTGEKAFGSAQISEGWSLSYAERLMS